MSDYKSAIFEKKYRYKDENIDEFYARVSGGDTELEALMRDDYFTFGGRILSNRGLSKHGIKITYSNCYATAQPDDNIESIFDVNKEIARIYSYGGGCGCDFSKLRPHGSLVNNAAKSTTGPVPFMKVLNTTTGVIGQDGRRGALMISLICTHPDILTFINAKNTEGEITQANISVRFTDDFLIAARQDKWFALTFKIETTGEVITKAIKAKEVMMDFAYNNWDNAEPGALFWDRINSWCIMSEDDEFEFAGVNPCAEQPLPAYGSCLLGSINLSRFVINPFLPSAKFDMNMFKYVVSKAVRSLNEVLDEGLPLHPLQQIRDSVYNYRQIGLGVMGYADMLIKMGMKYGSDDSLVLIDYIMSSMSDTALSTSALLAKSEGHFPKCKIDKLIASPYIQFNASESTMELIERYGLRNSQILTIAPTGSTAPLLNASWAAEPIYDVSYRVKTESLDGKESYYNVFTPIISELMEVQGLSDVHDLPDYVVSSKRIPWKRRIDTQATFQKYIDASISSTVNLPEYVGVRDVYELYMYSWEKGLKGVTVYRDNCSRSGTLTSTIEDNEVKYCPTCGTELAMVEGCKACPNEECSYAQCGL